MKTLHLWNKLTSNTSLDISLEKTDKAFLLYNEEIFGHVTLRLLNGTGETDVKIFKYYLKQSLKIFSL